MNTTENYYITPYNNMVKQSKKKRYKKQVWSKVLKSFFREDEIADYLDEYNRAKATSQWALNNWKKNCGYQKHNDDEHAFGGRVLSNKIVLDDLHDVAIRLEMTNSPP